MLKHPEQVLQITNDFQGLANIGWYDLSDLVAQMALAAHL